MSSEIQKICNIILFICYSLVAILAMLILLQWVATDTSLAQTFFRFGIVFFSPIMTAHGPVSMINHHFSFTEKLIGFAGTTIGLLPLILALVLLIKIFKRYSMGNIFSLENVICYKYLGYLFFFDALLAKPIREILLSLVATLTEAPDHPRMIVGFGIPNLESIAYGTIIIVIARVMHVGYKIQEEQQLVI